MAALWVDELIPILVFPVAVIPYGFDIGVVTDTVAVGIHPFIRVQREAVENVDDAVVIVVVINRVDLPVPISIQCGGDWPLASTATASGQQKCQQQNRSPTGDVAAHR